MKKTPVSTTTKKTAAPTVATANIGFSVQGKSATIASSQSSKQEQTQSTGTKQQSITQAPAALAQKEQKKSQNQIDQKSVEKVEQKEEEKQVIETKKQQTKIDIVVPKKQEAQTPAPSPPDVFGQITLKYNHYKDEFQIQNGKLEFPVVDQKWCFSYVYKGNWAPQLKQEKSKQYINHQNFTFENLEDKKVYIVEIQEDPQELEQQAKAPVRTLVFEQEDVGQKNHRIDHITNELKNMSIDQLKEKGDKYKQLIQARDLEDCLYQ